MAKIIEEKTVKTTDLIPYANNSRTHSAEQVDQIVASINEFGFISPILCDPELNIIAGHGRVMAAEKIGMKSVPVVIIEGLTEEQRRAYIIADNRLTELGGWNMDAVNIELADLDAAGFDISLTGFDFNFAEDPEIIEDELPEPPAKARTKLGDIWQLGDHRLICGDSTDVQTFEKLLNGGTVNICVTSPPYNAGHMDVALSKDHGGGYQSETQRKYLKDDDQRTEDEYFDFISSNIDALLIYSDEIFYNVGVGAGSKTMIARLLHKYAGEFKDLMYWEKENPMPVIVESVISSAVELVICLGRNGSRSFNHFNDRMFHGVIKGLSASTSNKYADIHKATFPVYFPSEIIKRFAPTGGTVLDCFGGTGTTLIACEQTGRKCYMIELEPIYCDVIVDRWEKLTGRKAALVNE